MTIAWQLIFSHMEVCFGLLMIVLLHSVSFSLAHTPSPMSFGCIIYSMRPSFFHHLHPPSIPSLQARFRYTLGAGGLAVFLVLILGITGILEVFYYIPTPDGAALSIQTLTFLVPFGGLVRNLHFWAAQFLVIVSLIHLLRVVFTGAYLPPRRFNYLLGMALLVLAVFLDFTGYVLRWDEGIRWALVTGTNLLKSIPLIGAALYTSLVGGDQPGAATLIRFYGWHIYGLTIAAVIMVGWHLFRVRRDGGIAVPPPSLRETQQRISRFELVRREVLAMLLASVALLIVSVVAPAPLAAPIGAASTLPETARAPWFFLWVQQLLKLGKPFLWGLIVPFSILVFIALIPYIFPKPAQSELGRWFPKSNRLVQVICILIASILLVLTILALIPAS
jgi:quinol-cytochrome oxidoreductase complex cytochrome b subunit